jgi:hypothetical protein
MTEHFDRARFYPIRYFHHVSLKNSSTLDERSAMSLNSTSQARKSDEHSRAVAKLGGVNAFSKEFQEDRVISH